MNLSRRKKIIYNSRKLFFKKKIFYFTGILKIKEKKYIYIFVQINHTGIKLTNCFVCLSKNNSSNFHKFYKWMDNAK